MGHFLENILNFKIQILFLFERVEFFFIKYELILTDP